MSCLRLHIVARLRTGHEIFEEMARASVAASARRVGTFSYDERMARKSKPERTPRLVRLPKGREPGVLAIPGRKELEFYGFREIPCAIGGRGFKVQRIGRPDLYHVRIGLPEQCSCECLGYLRHGKCKHIGALQTVAK